MKVLVINCGSSSLKYQLIDSESEKVLAKGLCERIGIDGRLTYQKAGLDKEITEVAMPTHKEAISLVLNALTNDKTGAVKDLKEIDAIAHRIVHGGEEFAGSAIVTDALSVCHPSNTCPSSVTASTVTVEPAAYSPLPRPFSTTTSKVCTGASV